MRIYEGRGFLLRTGQDGPLAGWLPLRVLDGVVSVREAPWMALQAMAGVAGAFPGGLALLWDAPLVWLDDMTPEHRRAFMGTLVRLPGLQLHFREEAIADELEGPVAAWFHAPESPTGRLGQAWRQGWIGWVPESGSAWSIPGFGKAQSEAEEPFSAGSLWGEVALPLGALAEIGINELASVMGDAQAKLEWDFSLRLSARAWPEAFPFLRRRAGWRVSFLGGREFEVGRGDWEQAAARVKELANELRETLRCPIWVGSCHDIGVASRLGHQAMREGLPWRASLPIPPAPPLFAPGFGTDPRELSAIEARATFPAAMSEIVAHPPIALLRVPHVPQESAVAALMRGMTHPPAIRWLPPEIPPPCPFTAERPWPAAGAFTPLMDITQALQMSLFDDLE
ncbi:MAG: hypothetical protein Q8O00_15385 [Holophaga sp.]|nr:hypothetical protein [Holophaga sp.]